MTSWLLLISIIASPAFASGTSVGNGRVNCREGAKDHLYEHNAEGGTYRTLTYTCQRGRWVNLEAADNDPVEPMACREGSIEYFPDNEGQYSETPPNVAYVCRKGIFHKVRYRRR